MLIYHTSFLLHEGCVTSCPGTECRYRTYIWCWKIMQCEQNFKEHWAAVCALLFVRVHVHGHTYSMNCMCVQALRPGRLDQWNWSPQVESNSVISPAELIPTSQERHTVNSLRSALSTLTPWLSHCALASSQVHSALIHSDFSWHLWNHLPHCYWKSREDSMLGGKQSK